MHTSIGTQSHTQTNTHTLTQTHIHTKKHTNTIKIYKYIHKRQKKIQSLDYKENIKSWIRRLQKKYIITLMY